MFALFYLNPTPLENRFNSEGSLVFSFNYYVFCFCEGEEIFRDNAKNETTYRKIFFRGWIGILKLVEKYQ
jgi:hypothetical protein